VNDETIKYISRGCKEPLSNQSTAQLEVCAVGPQANSKSSKSSETRKPSRHQFGARRESPGGHPSHPTLTKKTVQFHLQAATLLSAISQAQKMTASVERLKANEEKKIFCN